MTAKMRLTFIRANDNPFPPKSWLGFGLDMTAVTPTDIKSVTEAVLKVTRVIALDPSSSSQSFGGVTWMIPNNVDFASDVKVGTCGFSRAGCAVCFY